MVCVHCSVRDPCCIPVQYTADNFTANEVDPPPERTWSLSSSVKSLTYSRGSDYVYAVTETEVSFMQVLAIVHTHACMHMHTYTHAHNLYTSHYRCIVSLLRSAPTSLTVVHVLQVEVDCVGGVVLRTSVAEEVNVPTALVL